MNYYFQTTDTSLAIQISKALTANLPELDSKTVIEIFGGTIQLRSINCPTPEQFALIKGFCLGFAAASK